MKRRDRLAAQRRADLREAREAVQALRARMEAERLSVADFAGGPPPGWPTLGVPIGDHGGGDDCPLCRMFPDAPTETVTLPDGSTISVTVLR